MMKKFLRAALVLPLLLFAVSCSESGDEGGGNGDGVKLAPGTSTTQEVYADEAQGLAPIKFTAPGPWTATVVEVSTKARGGSEVDWLKLSAYSGGQGEVSLTVELQPNLTGKDRKAAIRISCGGVTITITVEQKGTTASGETPEDPDKPENPDTPTNYALVESIEVNYFAGCNEVGNRNTAHYEFRYDNQNRIAEYVISEYNYYNSDGKPELDEKHTTRFDYTFQDEIRLTETKSSGSSDYSETDTYRILLDNQGRAAQIKEDGGDKEDITYFAYNGEGRLTRISWYEYSDSELSYEDMTYQNGVISKVLLHEPGTNDEEIVFPADAFSDRPNDRLNIDPNWLMFTDPDEPQYMLPMLRLAGKSCDRLTLWLPNDDEDFAFGVPTGPYPDPNVTIHETHDYYEHETGRLQYTFNDDGTIATIVQPIVCIQRRFEYDIVVSNEPYHQGYPEGGYKVAGIENEKTTEIGRSKDQHEWKFTYRK